MKKKSTVLLAVLLVTLLTVGIALLTVASAASTDGEVKAAVSLGSDITLHLTAELTSAEAEGPVTVSFTMKGNTTEDPMKVVSGTTYGADFTGITPQCMNDTIEYSIKSNGSEIRKGAFSIADYCEKLMALEYSDKNSDGRDDTTGYYSEQLVAMKTLVNDLLVYGGAAQSYVGYETSDLAGAGRTATDYKLPTTSALQVTNGDGVTFTAATVNFNNINRIRIRFTAPSTEKLVIKCGDAVLDYEDAGDGSYLVYTDGIGASNFATVYTIKAYIDGAEVSSVSYSVNSYVTAKKSSEDKALKNLVIATFRYGKSAENFLEAENYAASIIYNTFDATNLYKSATRNVKTSIDVTYSGYADYNNAAHGYSTRTVSHTLSYPYDFDVKISTYIDKTKTYDENSNVIIYVVGHGEKRVGREGDVSIISSLLDEGYIVTVVDYLGNPKAISPYLEQNITVLRLDIENRTNTADYMGDLSYGALYHTYLVPAGDRIVRNIEYFDWTKSAAKGTLEVVEVAAWNKDSVQNRAAKKGMQGTVTDWKDIPMPDGTHLGDECNYEKYLKLRMDIVYPSEPDTVVPVVALASSYYLRNSSPFSPGGPEKIGFPGFQLRGYATVCYDHEYHVFMQGEGSWGDIQPDFSLQGYNGWKTHPAAMRCIRYYADQYGYSDELIGVYGHSKSSYVSCLATPHPENLLDEVAPTGYKRGENYGEQPFLFYESGEKAGQPIPSNAACVYFSMGYGAVRHEYVLTPLNSPTIICCGEYDEGTGMTYWFDENDAYYESGVEYLSISMWGIGHIYPVNKHDTVFDYNYYDAFVSFFDHNLKGEAINMLYTSADSGKIVASSDHGEPLDSDKLFIQFSNAVKPWSLRANTTVTNAAGEAVEGKWIAEQGGTRWVFVPAKALETGIYTLTVGTGITDEQGVRIADGYTVKFSVGGASAGGETLGKSVIG